MIKAVFFDFEGTIAKGLPVLIHCVNQLADEYKYHQITDSSELRSISLRDGIKNHLGLSLHQLPRFACKLKTLLDHHVKEIKLVTGIKPILVELAKKYSVGLITLVSQETVKHVLDRNQVKGIKFVYHDSPVFRKAQIIKHLMKRYCLDKSEVVYVGDRVEDIQACKKDGITIIAVTWGYNTKELLQSDAPDYLIDSPDELHKILREIA